MSFFDHFTGGALDSSRWTAVTSGSGSVSVSDSTAILDSPANADAGFIYYNTTLNKSVSQLWLACFKMDSLAGGHPLHIINKSTAPVAEAFSGGTDARQIIVVATRNSNAYEFRYIDSGGTAQRWNAGSNVWSTTGADSLGLIVTGDYIIVGIEFDADGGNSRWRMFGAHKTVSSGYSVDQGLRIFTITNWVNWSATRATADGLWLTLGDSYTDIQNYEERVEWVRQGDEAREYLYTNAKNATSGNYSIYTSWSYDKKFFIPRDRGATVDVADIKDPWVVFDGTTYHMFYRTMGTAPEAQLRRATSSSAEGTWTEQNTLIQPGANHQFGFPCVVYTPWETSGREWQCLFTDSNTTNGVTRIRLLTASAPGGTWTDQGDVLTEGAGGSFNEQGVTGATILHRNGEYEVWYTARKPGAVLDFLNQSGARATGVALNALTPDGNGVRLTAQDEVEALDANLDGNTVTISDTTGFEADQPVYLNQDTNTDNWSGSRVRKVTTNTSLELYHRLMGFTTANGAKVFGFRAGNQQIRDIKRVGAEWFVYLTTFNHSREDATIGTVFQEECSLLIVPAGTDLTGMLPSHYSLIDSPVVLRGSWSNIRSNENLSLIHGETTQSVSSGLAPLLLKLRRAH